MERITITANTARLAEQLGDAAVALEEARTRRDSLVKAAVALGMSAASVAAAAGVSRQRVYQILGEKNA